VSGFPTRAGAAAGASGLFTVTVIRPGRERGVVEHIAYGERAQAMEEIGWIAERAPLGAELVLRDPEGADLMRLARLA
jgi:hypothetical protein